MRHQHADRAHGGLGQQRSRQPTITRTCPRCGATAGQSCRQSNGGLVQGIDVGGAYMRRLKTFHPERRKTTTT